MDILLVCLVTLYNNKYFFAGKTISVLPVSGRFVGGLWRMGGGCNKAGLWTTLVSYVFLLEGGAGDILGTLISFCQMVS